MNAREWLDELDAVHSEGSKPRWSLVGGTHDREVIDDHGCHVATTGTFPDAALIVAAVNALPELTTRLRAVLDLADEMDARTAALGFRLDRIIPPGDCIRRAAEGADR